MEPKNHPIEKENHLPNHHFPVPAVNLPGCNMGIVVHPLYKYPSPKGCTHQLPWNASHAVPKQRKCRKSRFFGKRHERTIAETRVLRYLSPMKSPERTSGFPSFLGKYHQQKHCGFPSFLAAPKVDVQRSNPQKEYSSHTFWGDLPIIHLGANWKLLTKTGIQHTQLGYKSIAYQSTP